MGPPGLSLPAPAAQGVADDVRLGGVEARVEVDGDIWPGVQAAAALEVHLEPGDEAPKGHLRSETPGDPEGGEGALPGTSLTCVHLEEPLPGARPSCLLAGHQKSLRRKEPPEQGDKPIHTGLKKGPRDPWVGGCGGEERGTRRLSAPTPNRKCPNGEKLVFSEVFSSIFSPFLDHHTPKPHGTGKPDSAPLPPWSTSPAPYRSS